MTESTHEIIAVTDKNVGEYDLFCLKSKHKEQGYKNKVTWFREQFTKGLRIKLLRVYEGEKRGFSSRGFIEYVPGKHTWRGIEAERWMVIHCLWVVGRNKGKGYGSQLLRECILDAEKMDGVAVVTSEENWLPKKNLFIKHGFEKADEIPPFELYVKRLSETVPLPRFKSISKERLKRYGEGLVVVKSHQCPYAHGLTKTVEEMAEKAHIPVRIKHLSYCKDAQESGHPYGTFFVVLDGRVISYYPGDLTEVKKALTEKS
ncbi:MAG: GNAT family N-acetyltransferase [Theionarchaea archaeon]|nr:GNAT family N-acetyltransferase [Theionarchaea archaeon]